MGKAKLDGKARANADGVAEKICSQVNALYRDQVVTLARAVIAMQEKVEAEIPTYAAAPLYQEIVKKDGNSVLRPNPICPEFRAMARDYAASLNALFDIVENQKSTEAAADLDKFRAKLRIAK